VRLKTVMRERDGECKCNNQNRLAKKEIYDNNDRERVVRQLLSVAFDPDWGMTADT